MNSVEEEPLSISAVDRVVRSASCLSAEVGNETVLMSIESGCYGGLDDIGADIWRRIERPITVAEACDALASSYDAVRGAIEKDVLVFLDALQKKQMIEVSRG